MTKILDKLGAADGTGGVARSVAVIVAHPGVKSLADLKGKPIAIGAASNTTFWPWLKQKYGFQRPDFDKACAQLKQMYPDLCK